LDDFESDFRRAYAAKTPAHGVSKLNALSMTGVNIDS